MVYNGILMETIGIYVMVSIGLSVTESIKSCQLLFSLNIIGPFG